jgi:hypothetical protein
MVTGAGFALAGFVVCLWTGAQQTDCYDAHSVLTNLGALASVLGALVAIAGGVATVRTTGQRCSVVIGGIMAIGVILYGEFLAHFKLCG